MADRSWPKPSILAMIVSCYMVNLAKMMRADDIPRVANHSEIQRIPPGIMPFMLRIILSMPPPLSFFIMVCI